MKNLRILQKPTVSRQEQKDWAICSPEEAEFAFRVWGGSNEVPHLRVTDDLDFAKDKSEAAFLFIKTFVPHAKEVLSDLNYERMFKDRVGGDQNPGGNIFSKQSVVEEYIERCNELGYSCTITDVTQVATAQ